MTTPPPRHHPSEAMRLLTARRSRHAVHTLFGLSSADEAPVTRGALLHSTDPTLLLAAFPDAEPSELLTLAENPFTPEEVLADLAHDVVVLTSMDAYGDLRHVSVRRPHPQRAALRLLLTLNPSTADHIVSELIGQPVDALHPRSIALTSFYRQAAVEQRFTIAGHPHAPASLLSVLCYDEAPVVRCAVAANPATPLNDVLRLRNDTSPRADGLTAASVVASRKAELLTALTSNAYFAAGLELVGADTTEILDELARSLAPDLEPSGGLTATIRDTYFSQAD